MSRTNTLRALVSLIALAPLFAVLTLPACKEKPRAPATEALQKRDAAMAPRARVSRAAVQLLSEGAEPREPLRYLLSIGDIQTVSLVLEYGAVNRLRAAPQTSLNFPTMRLTFLVEILKALEGDRVRYSFELAEASISDAEKADGALVAMAGAALKASQGIRGTAVVNSQGVISDAEFSMDNKDPALAVMLESMKTSMEQLAVPLPVEAVGVGARWQARTELIQGGMTLDQTTMYELAASARGTLEIRSTIEQRAGRQPVEIANVKDAELISLSGDGTALIEVSLSRLAPPSAKYEVASESEFEFVADGRPRALVSNGSLTLGIKSQ